MKKNQFNKLKNNYYKENIIVTKYNGEKIYGKYDDEELDLGIIYVGSVEILIKDIKDINMMKDNQIYKYISVVYQDDDYEREYSYKTELNDIEIGDIVLVDRAGVEVHAEVVDINLYTRETAPYPVEKTKDIIAVIEHSDDYDDDYYDRRNTVNTHNYRYTYNGVENKVVEKLKKLGLNEKKCLRIVMMLRTHYKSDEQCEKMLKFLDTLVLAKNPDLFELEKYARTLADDDNWFNYSVPCPAVGEGDMSIIDCLDSSDEDIWKEHENDPPHEPIPGEVCDDFNEICKKCKWHNPIINDELYRTNEPIIITGLSEELLNNLKNEEIIAFTIAESGAMGCPGNIEIIRFNNNKLIGYETNPMFGGIPYYKFYRLIPWLEQFTCEFGFVNNVGEGWKHIDTGYGNHLLVRDFIYEELISKTKNKSLGEIYQSWKKWLIEINISKDYVRELIKAKPKRDGESVCDYILRNIACEEFLPYDFTLEPFRHYSKNDIHFADGMIDNCISTEKDENILEILKNLCNMLSKDTLHLSRKVIDDYYYEHNDRYIIESIDEFLDWLKNSDVDYKYIYSFAQDLMRNGKEIETVKIGISLLGLFDDLEEHIINIIKKLALSDELTLYCDSTLYLAHMDGLNEFRYNIVQKSQSYGKILLLPKINITSEEMKTWIFRYGCKNKIANGWLAIDVAEKIDIVKYIEENELNDKDINGLYNIIDGLLDDGPKDGISTYKSKKELFSSIAGKSKMLTNIIYLKILCRIKEYLKDNENDSEFIEQIDKILSNSKAKMTVKNGIVSNKNIDDYLYVSIFMNDLNIYDKLLQVFEENIKLGNEDYAISMLDLLFKKEDKIEDILKLLQCIIDFRIKLGKPQAIIDFRDKNLVNIINCLSDYPLKGIDFIIFGLKSKSMHPRSIALNVIKKWIDTQDKEAKDYLPLNLYTALLELKNCEIIKEYKKKINDILGIEENLSSMPEPMIRIKDETGKKREGINLYNGNIDVLFSNIIIQRGRDYYKDKMVNNCIKNGDTYIGYVQGSESETEYRVSIKIDKDDNIVSMHCSCPYEFNCKHEYATILYLRNYN